MPGIHPGATFIQTILPHGLSLPKVPKGDQVWQHSETVQPRVGADGNWSRQTDGRTQDFQPIGKSSTWTTRSAINATVKPWTSIQKRQSAVSKPLKPWAP